MEETCKHSAAISEEEVLEFVKGTTMVLHLLNASLHTPPACDRQNLPTPLLSLLLSPWLRGFAEKRVVGRSGCYPCLIRSW